ncbi:hypothetical protein MRX96_032793 [Rhipicephalus microplus]
MPGVTRIVVLFHLSCVMMVISFVAGSLAGTFNIIRSGPEVSELLFVVYLSYVSHISLARQRHENATLPSLHHIVWVIRHRITEYDKGTRHIRIKDFP